MLFPFLNAVEEEVRRAILKYPTWPTDPLHALTVVTEEHGELAKAMLQMCYEPGKSSLAEVRTEAIQLAAMAIRLVMSLEYYEYKPGVQHEQGLTWLDYRKGLEWLDQNQ